MSLILVLDDRACTASCVAAQAPRSTESRAQDATAGTR
jgi:hypothetical protein